LVEQGRGIGHLRARPIGTRRPALANTPPTGAQTALAITRGILPLVLSDHRVYGALVGNLLVPSFLLSAAAPLAYAVVIERFGDAAALHLSIAVAAVTLAAAVMLKVRSGPAVGHGRSTREE
jgi:hypothetical protein